MQEIAQAQADFLKNDYIPLLQTLTPDATRKWGKMGVQQMIEHMADSFRIASGRMPQELITPEEHVGKMQDFIRSDKQFRENTPNRLMGDEPQPHRLPSISAATTELQSEIDYFFEVFNSKPDHIILNALFGMLNYELWVRLLYKHAWHHLRQFGIEATLTA